MIDLAGALSVGILFRALYSTKSAGVNPRASKKPNVNLFDLFYDRSETKSTFGWQKHV
jgi:hypothetical protein